MRIDPSHPIDLSQPIGYHGPAWADYDPPTITHEYRRAVEGFNAETVRMNTHTGHPCGRALPLRRRGRDGRPAPARHVRRSGRVHRPARARPSRAADDARSPKAGPGSHPARRLRRARHRLGRAARPDEHYLKRWPYLSGKGAEALVERGVAGVGIDALSIGGWGGPERGEPSHLALLGAGVLIIEELRIPHEVLDGKRFYLTAFPVLLEGCGGSWTRAVAWPLDDGG